MKDGRKRKLLVWGVIIVILLIPVPVRGIWLPLLFYFFEFLNNYLPANF